MINFATFEIYYLRTTLPGVSGDSLHFRGSREIDGVYGRYLQGYWGSEKG